MEYKGTKYPKECFTVVRDKTLAITPELYLATATEGFAPLKVYNSFSRFTFTIINEKKAVTANVKIEEFENIKRLSNIAQSMDVQAGLFIPINTNEADCYGEKDQAWKSEYDNANGTRIMNGIHKGKTPIEVLCEDPESGSKALTTQKEWLKRNLEQYPGNLKQINAIESALKLYESGDFKIQSSDIQTMKGKRIRIYSAEYRPLVRKARESDGKCPVYHIDIRWNIGQEYPVTISIINYYAPVSVTKEGLFNVHASQAVDRICGEICLTAAEWNNALRALRAAMFQFEVLHARDCINDAADAERRNRQAVNYPPDNFPFPG